MLTALGVNGDMRSERALRFGRLWYSEIPHAIGYAKFYSRYMTL
jgi:hypothetical protein